MHCGVDCRCGLDLVLLWLWYRLEATVPIRPLAWELPYAASAALKSKKKKKRKKRKEKEIHICYVKPVAFQACLSPKYKLAYVD